MMRRIAQGITVILLLSAVGAAIFTTQVNNYQVDGKLRFTALDEPVRVVRDAMGVPYVYANSQADAIRTQGFLAAQDRLGQLSFLRHVVYGRLSELIGEAGRDSDIQIRVIGIPQLAQRQADLLSPASRSFIEHYLEGLNAYIRTGTDEHPLGVKLLKPSLEPWTVLDVLTVEFFMNWASTKNLRSELLAQSIADRVGIDKALQISKLTVNPDYLGDPRGSYAPGQSVKSIDLNIVGGLWSADLYRTAALGSNQWVVSPAHSTTGSAVMASDPHIDSRALPGVWHPIGLFWPGYRVIGAAGPGTPGFAVARTDAIAFSVTNSNGDGIDLFIETLDPENPEHYLEGEESIPFVVREETLRILDRAAGDMREETFLVRSTHRGPVISDHGMDGGNSERVLSMRWAAAEAMVADLGRYGLMFARSLDEAAVYIGNITAPYNFVIADTIGNIGHFTSGRVPVRKTADGSAPQPVVDGEDAWAGMIPQDEMPASRNPARGWVGNANHRTLTPDYPYVYSTDFAHSWRYRRMLQLLDREAPISPEEHWQFIRDKKNVLAELVMPMMLPALQASEETRWMGNVLEDWDFRDDERLIEPTIYHSVFRHFAQRVFADELGDEVGKEFLDSIYYWQDRLYVMMLANDSPWFDDINTEQVETRDELFQLAALDANEELKTLIGPDPLMWEWGFAHTISFPSPLMPGELSARYLGGGIWPMSGSNDTLLRSRYTLTESYATNTIDSMRFVADMGDPDKVMAVLSGGVSGRQFDSHLKDQMFKWLSGEENYWWFSDAAIEEHKQHELMLVP